MVEINGIFDSLFEALSKGTSMIRGLVNSMAPDYSNLIILGLAFGGGYLLVKRYPNLASKQIAIVLVGLSIFLLLRFV